MKIFQCFIYRGTIVKIFNIIDMYKNKPQNLQVNILRANEMVAVYNKKEFWGYWIIFFLLTTLLLHQKFYPYYSHLS